MGSWKKFVLKGRYMYGCFLDIHKISMNYVLLLMLTTLILSSISAVNVVGLII